MLAIKLDGWLHPEDQGAIFHQETRVSQGSLPDTFLFCHELHELTRKNKTSESRIHFRVRATCPEPGRRVRGKELTTVSKAA